MNSQYAIQASVRYYGFVPREMEEKKGLLTGILNLSRNVDTTRWTIQPHVRLANLPTYNTDGSTSMRPENDLKLDIKAAEAFVRRYGPVYTEHDVWFHDPRFPSGYFKEDVQAISGAQFLLRAAWAGDQETMSEHFSDGTLSEAFEVASFEILQGYATRGTSEVLLETKDLWEYIRYLSLTDFAEKRLAVCEREDCPTPYFVQQRGGQRYCSHECAVLENVRRFRANKKTSKKRGSK